MKALKYGVMLLTVLFLSQLHVYAEGNQWAWPVEGQISDYFGTRHGKHYGIDISGTDRHACVSYSRREGNKVLLFK